MDLHIIDMRKLSKDLDIRINYLNKTGQPYRQIYTYIKKIN